MCVVLDIKFPSFVLLNLKAWTGSEEVAAGRDVSFECTEQEACGWASHVVGATWALGLGVGQAHSGLLLRGSC